ncbi:MAG: M20/M25/M40 family metallo-hydrolase [Myxococcales bacterium]|nr:M20/M25/M40 family metallo-hydrolase [Myxococcales bacterium]
MRETAALEWLRGQGEAIESSLAELVNVSSYTGDKAGCDAVGAMLRELVPLGCEAVPSERFGDHLFFSSRRAAREGGVILVGHHDTVFPKSVFDGFRVDGGLVRGPGVLDMKGGLVVIAWALRALREVDLLDKIALTLAVVSDEEVGSPDSAAQLRRRAAGASAALVFESGRVGDAIITRRKGIGSVDVTVKGRAAHAGNGHREGVNAIWALSRFVDRAQSLSDYAREVTVNVGLIHGGMGRNTVPDAARAELEFRYASKADGDALLAALKAHADDLGVPGAQVALDTAVQRTPLERTEASARLYEAYAAAQRAAGLGDVEAALIGGGSDASNTADAGVPSIDGLGPRGAGFHTVNEYAERASFVPKAEALVRFLMTQVSH